MVKGYTFKDHWIPSMRELGGRDLKDPNMHTPADLQRGSCTKFGYKGGQLEWNILHRFAEFNLEKGNCSGDH